MIDLVKKYAESYHVKHLDMEMHDPKGVLVCPVDTIPLSWYVNYNNFWWMHFVKSATPKATLYNSETNVGFVSFELEYYSVPTFHFVQFLRFNDQHKIDFVRTYWNFAWALELTKNNLIMKAIQTGDALWMRKDIDLKTKEQFARDYWTDEAIKDVLNFDPGLQHLVDTFKYLYRV